MLNNNKKHDECDIEKDEHQPRKRLNQLDRRTL